MNRRHFLAASLTAPLSLSVNPAWATDTRPPFVPEAGASLDVIRWKRYTEGDENQYMANAALFTQLTGIKVNVTHVNVLELASLIDDVRQGQKHADVVLSIDAEAYRHHDMWMQVNDLEAKLAPFTGKWDPIATSYLRANGKDWMGIPLGISGNTCFQRISYLRQAGFSELPQDTAGFLELCKSLNSIGKPAGFALDQSAGEGNSFAYWLLWAFGGFPLNENNEVRLESSETLAALEYAKKLYQVLMPGCVNWGDVHNNQYYLTDKLSLTYNGMNMYYPAIENDDELETHILQDTRCGNLPRDKHKQLIESSGFFMNQLIIKKTHYPNAAKAFIYFMMQPKQYAAWITESKGFVSAVDSNYRNNPVWQTAQQIEAFKNVGLSTRALTWGGVPGPAFSRIRAQRLVARMFADVVKGKETPQDAMRIWSKNMKIVVGGAN